MTRTVFVVMPSSVFMHSIEKKEIIRLCALESGWSLQIPEYEKRAPSFDLSSTMAALREIDLALVDLSDERPSCYFELGLAEASGTEIAAVALKNTPIHQTSLRESIVFFDDLADFRERIRKILNQRK